MAASDPVKLDSHVGSIPKYPTPNYL